MRVPSRLFLVLLLLVSANTAGEVASRRRPDPGPARWVRHTLRHMSLEEKVGQLFMVWVRAGFINPTSPEYAQLRDTMQKYHLGSFGITAPTDDGVLIKPSPLETAALTNQLQSDSKLPLLFAADLERGLPMRLSAGTAFPHAMAFGATENPEYAYEFGRITAAEARAVGIHWNFYPDADVNSNPANPIINTRSFGEDPAEVSSFVTAFIRGVHAGGGMATAKHFPGHGDTSTDSHLALSRIDASREHLNRIELPPFRAAIAAGVDSVMVGHLLVPALEPDPNRTATISHRITTGLLQNELGFHGIVITDAMNMNGLTHLFAANGSCAAYGDKAPGAKDEMEAAGAGEPSAGGGCNAAQVSGRAAVEAIEAGADVILIPADLDAAYNAVLDAVRSGEISESRIDSSVVKLLRAKAALGLYRNRFVDLDAIPELLERPEATALAQKVADDAITLVREDDVNAGVQTQARFVPAALASSPQLLPLPKPAPPASQPDVNISPQEAVTAPPAPESLLVLVFTDDMRNEDGRTLVREVRARVPNARVLYVDDTLAFALAPQVQQAVATAGRIVAAVYDIPTAGRARAGKSGVGPALGYGTGCILGSVLNSAADRTVVVSLGNPYLITQYPEIRNYVSAYSNMPPSERAAVRFLFGEIDARGRLPVSIPGVASRGSTLALRLH